MAQAMLGRPQLVNRVPEMVVRHFYRHTNMLQAELMKLSERLNDCYGIPVEETVNVATDDMSDLIAALCDTVDFDNAMWQYAEDLQHDFDIDVDKVVTEDNIPSLKEKLVAVSDFMQTLEANMTMTYYIPQLNSLYCHMPHSDDITRIMRLLDRYEEAYNDRVRLFTELHDRFGMEDPGVVLNANALPNIVRDLADYYFICKLIEATQQYEEGRLC